MKRVKGLGRYPKGILLFMTIMFLVFTILYPMTISREGFAYKNVILIPSYEDDSIVYSGKIQGKQASFTVFADGTVIFQYDGKTYGPYSVREDADAIPKDSELRDDLVGIELRQGEEILFRGAILNNGNHRLLYNEDGSIDFNITMTTDHGIMMDEYGNVIDPMEPSVSTILDLTVQTKLTHKGSWLPWFGGVLVCIVTAISILFADELFRWRLSFQIRDAERAEPSEWEIAGRYIEWTVSLIVAMAIFIAGLQQ